MADPDQHRDKRQRTGDGAELDHTIHPTNHERQLKQEDEEKSDIPTIGDIEMHDGAGDPELDELEKDMGEPFLLCRSSKALLSLPAVSCHVC